VLLADHLGRGCAPRFHQVLLLTVVFWATAHGFAFAQCQNVNDPETVAWVNRIIVRVLGEDEACRTAAPDRDVFASSTACNIFVGRLMARSYDLRSFVSKSNTYLTANEIAALIPTWPDWIDLGSAGDQKSLTAAAHEANLGYIVLAVWGNPVANKPGHVALIGPGRLTTSAAWGGLKTPVAASFTLDNSDAAFLGQPLSCAIGGSKRNATRLWKYKILTRQR
jgi:hypothetical protein